MGLVSVVSGFVLLALMPLGQGAASVNGYGGNNTPIIRYAEVILMLAEVKMYLGNDALAIQYGYVNVQELLYMLWHA